MLKISARAHCVLSVFCFLWEKHSVLDGFNYRIVRINIFKVLSPLWPSHTWLCSVYSYFKNICIHFLYVLSPNLASNTVLLPPWIVLPQASHIPAIQSKGQLLCDLSVAFDTLDSLKVSLLCSCDAIFLAFTPVLLFGLLGWLHYLFSQGSDWHSSSHITHSPTHLIHSRYFH